MTSNGPRDEQNVKGVVEFANQALYGGDVLAEAKQTIERLDPGAERFARGAPGGLGELCRHLREQWSRALQARAHEAQQQAERLTTAGEALARMAARYSDSDATLATEITAASSPDTVRPVYRALTVRPDQGAGDE